MTPPPRKNMDKAANKYNFDELCIPIYYIVSNLLSTSGFSSENTFSSFWYKAFLYVYEITVPCKV